LVELFPPSYHPSAFRAPQSCRPFSALQPASLSPPRATPRRRPAACSAWRRRWRVARCSFTRRTWPVLWFGFDRLRPVGEFVARWWWVLNFFRDVPTDTRTLDVLRRCRCERRQDQEYRRMKHHKIVPKCEYPRCQRSSAVHRQPDRQTARATVARRVQNIFGQQHGRARAALPVSSFRPSETVRDHAASCRDISLSAHSWRVKNDRRGEPVNAAPVRKKDTSGKLPEVSGEANEPDDPSAYILKMSVCFCWIPASSCNPLRIVE
jgi:hypothetical protein